MTELTRTQRKAEDDLLKHGRLWPSGRGRFAVSGTGHPPYSKRTLQALVDAGRARWVYRDGVMPHIVRAYSSTES